MARHPGILLDSERVDRKSLPDMAKVAPVWTSLATEAPPFHSDMCCGTYAGPTCFRGHTELSIQCGQAASLAAPFFPYRHALPVQQDPAQFCIKTGSVHVAWARIQPYNTLAKFPTKKKPEPHCRLSSNIPPNWARANLPFFPFSRVQKHGGPCARANSPSSI